jgi:hypothetical protein
MANFVHGTIAEVLTERPGFQQVTLVRDGGAAPERAYVVTALTGTVAVGDEVLANTTAVDLGLGTGGWHVVSANLSRGAYDTPGGGHIMKLRYTPMQLDTGVAEERLDDLPSDLDGATVVACTLHSQVPVVVLAARAVDPTLRIAYVMTDGAALPIAFSGLVHEMTERGWLAAGTVTAGHAFGGMREAVGVPSALAVAHHDAGTDLIVVGMGPGVVGTGHRLATTALEAAPILDVAAALGARPILCVRASSGDARPRHRGLSHHSATVLDLVRSSVDVPAPTTLLPELAPHAAKHRLIDVGQPDGAALLDAAGLRVTTMGRGPEDDALFFDTAAAAGQVAAGKVG